MTTTTASPSHDDAEEGGRRPVLIVHRDSPHRTNNRMPHIDDDDDDDDRAIAHPHRRRRRRVFLFLGYRTLIGPAGTKGAPGLTTRRTHRGSLKEYALKKNRIGTSSGAAGADDANADADAGNAQRRRLAMSTAMEPEIGFLMANLALSGVVVWGRRRARVLDPCCGGGRLLLYAAASGATGPLIVVDSDLDVWDSAEWEERHRGGGVVVGKSSPLPAVVPTFVVGDV